MQSLLQQNTESNTSFMIRNSSRIINNHLESLRDKNEECKVKLILKCIGGPCNNLWVNDIHLNAKGVIVKSLSDELKNQFYLKKDGCTYFGSTA